VTLLVNFKINFVSDIKTREIYQSQLRRGTKGSKHSSKEVCQVNRREVQVWRWMYFKAIKTQVSLV